MLLKSYLIYPSPGGREQLLSALSLLPECEVIPADNQNLFIVITTTASREEDERLEYSISMLDGFCNMALVSGYCASVEEGNYA